MKLALNLPLPPNLNGSGWGGHFRTRETAKQKYWKLLDTLVTVRQLPRTPMQRWSWVEGNVEMRTCPVMDQDNANRRMKWIWDWLESRGYITNDRVVRCYLTPVASKRKDQGVVLDLEVNS